MNLNLSIKYLSFVSLLVCTFLCYSCVADSNKYNLVDYVNVMIGTAPSTTLSARKHSEEGSEKNAQVIPSVTAAWGMTNWTPETRVTENKCEAPYYYSDSIFTGIRGSHWLSGSCTQDYGSFSIMPVSGELNCSPVERGVLFSHDKEKASPYDYILELNNVDITVTASKRCGWLKFNFKNNVSKHIVINPNNDFGEGFIQYLPEENEIIGYNPVHRIYQGWGEKAGFKGYFVCRINTMPSAFGMYKGNDIQKGELQIQDQKDIGAWMSFNDSPGSEIDVLVGTSFNSVEEARNNLNEELGGKSYDQVRDELKDNWNELFGRVKVSSSNPQVMEMFYTAMYHSMQQPRLYSDVDGSYPAFSTGKTVVGTMDYYDDFSMWDTYRALHPLYNLLFPEYNKNMVHSLVDKAEKGGWLPIFPCWNSYTSAMIGDHAITVIADAYTKGIYNLDEKGYSFLRKNAFESPAEFKDYKDGMGRRALKSYVKYGYIPLEDSVKESFHPNEQVSRTMEYAYDDYALALIAKGLHKTDDYDSLIKRSENYKNVFDTSIGFVLGRYANGEFVKDYQIDSRMSWITEGTPWQYSFYVPQNVPAIIKLMGGKSFFEESLDSLFLKDQYWHGNEPGHQIPYLYDYSYSPHKTQAIVRKILDEEYGTGPGGLSGNDDSGQMSAWYVFSALGFYPVDPVSGEYALGSSLIDNALISLANGKTFEINVTNNRKKNVYVKSMKLNGQSFKSNFLTYRQIIQGGVLEIEMGR